MKSRQVGLTSRRPRFVVELGKQSQALLTHGNQPLAVAGRIPLVVLSS